MTNEEVWLAVYCKVLGIEGRMVRDGTVSDDADWLATKAAGHADEAVLKFKSRFASAIPKACRDCNTDGTCNGRCSKG